MVAKSKLYTDIVKVSEEYLGPAGERFIRRQLETHFAIHPEDIQQKHLPELIEWSRLMLAVVTSDTKIIDNFTNSLLMLSGKHPIQTRASNTRR